MIKNCKLADNVTIYSHSVLSDSEIKQQAFIGPFTHIQAGTIIGQETEIGNFVEVKRSIINTKTKAKHLSYLGDAVIGSNVNIGAGTITCNYDGQNKHTTTIEDNAFIGSNNTLIAPITIEKNAYTAGGSVITNNVPQEALAIARARQVNKEGYAKKLKEQKNNKSGNSDDSTLLFKGAQRADSETMI
jgi:bifunctional UDP-N-acetylglucosamine pyrophosphorylase/glucosamine-1-phosphate N-acetyltransferase